MSTHAWDLLVRRLEVEAKMNSRGYRLRVAALAALGYAYIGAILLALATGIGLGLVLLLSGHAVAVKLLLVFGILTAVILRALPVKLEPPPGHELRREDAPELFALIERLTETTAAPRIHHVLVDGALNAAVAQVPRFGWFGPTRNYLLIGLPLLAALSPDEFEAVMAHELGHVSGRHGRFSAWIYRVRRTWDRLLTTLEDQGHWGAGLFRRFFRWYAPYFSAYSFVLAREQEYEADRVAAAAAGPAAAASALARLELVGQYLAESYWPSVYRETETSPTPTADPLSELPERLRSHELGDELQAFVRPALLRRTDTADTHPSLTDRLEALGVVPTGAVEDARSAIESSAAERFLPDAHRALNSKLDTAWRDDIAGWWQAEHEESRQARARLTELDARADRELLEPKALLERAHLVERFRGTDEALSLYRAVLEREPRDAVANFVVGRALLGTGDARGLLHLDAAMEAEPESILAASQLAVDFLVEAGREADADEYRGRAGRRVDALDSAYEERQRLDLRGEVRSHDLPSESTASIAEQLQGHKEIKRAYLARRVLDHLDDEFPSYVLAVEIKTSSWKLETSDPRPRIVRTLAAELDVPFDFFVVDLKEAGRLKRRVRRLDGAEVYARP